MVIEDKERAFREGRVVRRAAETIMRETEAKGEPTRDAYDMALKEVEPIQESSEENAELLVDSLNIWADIEGTIGETEAKHLESIHLGIVRAHGSEITEFLKGGREIEDVLNILEEALGEDEVGARMIEKHPDLKPQLAEYLRLTLEVAKAGAE